VQGDTVEGEFFTRGLRPSNVERLSRHLDRVAVAPTWELNLALWDKAAQVMIMHRKAPLRDRLAFWGKGIPLLLPPSKRLRRWFIRDMDRYLNRCAKIVAMSPSLSFSQRDIYTSALANHALLTVNYMNETAPRADFQEILINRAQELRQVCDPACFAQAKPEDVRHIRKKLAMVNDALGDMLVG